jgi:NADPH:quinone reductase-like Zn-dependent oxidoreductase
MRLCVDKGIRPVIHQTLPLRDARQGFESMLQGETVGKTVFTN